MEINLVEQVELKLLLATSEDKFSSALAIFLVPLIQKLASTNDEVVVKVAEVLRFIQEKKSNSTHIIYPTEKLLEKFEEHVFDTSTGIVRQNKQLLSFLGFAMEDNPSSIRLDRLVRGLRNFSHPCVDVKANAAAQYSLFLFMLNYVTEKASDSIEAVPIVDISKWDPRDLDELKSKLAQLFLLNLKQYSMLNQPVLSSEDTQLFVEYSSKLKIQYPLVSELGINTTRKSVLKLVKCHPQQFTHVLVAAMGDSMLDISRSARNEVQKLTDFDYHELQHWGQKGSLSLRIEILELMLRRRHLKFHPDLILAGFTHGDLKLRLLSLELLHLVSTDSEIHWDSAYFFQFYDKLRQYIVDDGWPRSQAHSSIQTRLRQYCYELLGDFDNSQKTLNFLFQSLERDNAEMASSIQKALTKVLENGNEKIDASKLLRFMQRSHNQRTRYVAVQFAVFKLSPMEPLRAIICLLGLDPSQNRSDVVLESQSGLLCKSIEELPDFMTLLQSVQENLKLDNGVHDDLVNYTLLFLLACLIRWPTLTSEWYKELNTMISVPSSPLDGQLSSYAHNTQSFCAVLLSFVRVGAFYPVVPQLLRRILKNNENFSESFKSNIFVKVLDNEDNKYGPFVAEYIMQLSHDANITGNNSLQLLARSYKSSQQGIYSQELEELVIASKSIEALQVLAAGGMLQHNGKLNSLIKQSQLAIACFSLTSDKDGRKKVIENLLSFKSKGFDDIVANGEAISVAISGWNSKVLQEKYPNMRQRMNSLISRSWDLEKGALELVTLGIKGSPESRRIACVRLLCLVQYSFHNTEDLQGVAKGIQSCFMNLLSDSDDVTQESAGRGLSILFGLSNQNKTLQDELLSSLLSSFTDDVSAKKHTAGTLTAETQVFEPGSLPSEPRGDSSISTYKDVMTLANETGDSSLVYKFMSLSASSQVWTGRKGIAFSLEQILVKSELVSQILNGVELGQKLIPKLFRYMYDPIEVTQTAMKNIWLAMVPASKRSQVIKLYLTLISKEMYSGIFNREWRVRQGSVAALADLVSQGFIEHSVDLWKAGFRAVDDIKESVSKAGSELLKVVANALVRVNTNSSTSDLSEIVPFLLKGLSNESTVEFSLTTLLRLSETKGFHPWAAQIVEELCLQLSSLEPQALNYFALNSNQEVVDEVREKGLRNSSIMQGIEAMVERESPSITELWQILPRIVKRSVGVSSKLAGARLITLASMMTYTQKDWDNEPLLLASVAELWGNNVLISSHYASALGYLCRKVPLQLALKYVEILRAKFVNSEADDSKFRKTIGSALLSLSNNAGDVFSALSSTTLPVAFVGTFLTDESKNFKKVWESNTGGEASLRLYRTELVQFCCELLNNSSVRALKTAAAQVLAKTLSVDSSLTNSDALSVNNALLSNLSGRSWPGKEHIFEAVIANYNNIGDQATKTIVEERILNEVQRRNLEYKLRILPSVVKFLKGFTVLDFQDRAILTHVKTQVVEGIFELCDNDDEEKVKACQAVLELGDLSSFKHALEIGSWKYRLAACKSIQDLSFSEDLWCIVCKHCSGDEGYEKVRLEWSHAASKFKDNELVQQDIHKRIKVETSSLVLKILENSLIG